jgi:hypothetical protein
MQETSILTLSPQAGDEKFLIFFPELAYCVYVGTDEFGFRVLFLFLFLFLFSSHQI